MEIKREVLATSSVLTDTPASETDLAAAHAKQDFRARQSAKTRGKRGNRQQVFANIGLQRSQRSQLARPERDRIGGVRLNWQNPHRQHRRKG